MSASTGYSGIRSRHASESKSSIKGTDTIHLCQLHNKRSRSWFRFLSRQIYRPSFLGRRAVEKESRIRATRRNERPLQIDLVVDNHNPSDKPTLAVKAETLRVVGVSKENASSEAVSWEKNATAQQTDTKLGQTSPQEENGVGQRITTRVPEAADALDGKTAHSVKNELLERWISTTPALLSVEFPRFVPQPHNSFLRPTAPCRESTAPRKKMRTVNQDDYLVARGANPRTGIVTPSVHSGSSSIDDTEWLRIKELSQPAKWRLKDDQWISMGLDEPTPFPNSPAEPNSLRHGRPLRIPPKLANGGQRQQVVLVGGEEQNKANFADGKSIDRFRKARTPQWKEREHPTLERASADLDKSGTNTIKRKPLGSPPGRRSASTGPAIQESTELSTRTVMAQKDAVRPARSSPIPTVQEPRSSRAEDGGKALPALPRLQIDPKPKIAVASQSQKMPAWGLRSGDWIEDTTNWRVWEHQPPEKRLPCRPTNGVQFRPRSLRQRDTRVSPAVTLATQSDKPRSKQRPANFSAHIDGKSWAVQLSGSPVSPRHHQLVQTMHLQPKTRQQEALKMPRPNCSTTFRPMNPSQLKSMSEHVAMTTPGVEGGSDRNLGQSIATDITTPTTLLQTSPEDRLVSSSWRELPSPLRLGQQRANTGPPPAMAQRAEGTHSVPQVNPQKEPPGIDLWRMTGLSDSEISAVSSPREGTLERDLVPRPLRPSTGNAAGTNRQNAAAAEEGYAAGGSCLTKLCQSCRVPSADAKRHHMDSLTNTHQRSLTENVDPQVDLSSTSGFLQSAEEDHSSCCPECCVVGCHGSCLGHRCPSAPALTSGFGRTLNAMKSSFRDSMRLSRRTRIRTSAGGSQETETEEVAELETPTSWEVSGPVSLGIPSNTSLSWVGAGNASAPGHQSKRVASNSSNASIRTCDMPTTGGGIAALLEAATVPFGATSMWLNKHPQLLVLLQVTILRLFDMGKHVMGTMGKAYRMAYIYSKTGRVSIGKHGSLSGFARDCVKAVAYGLILGAVAVVLGRLLAVVAGAGRWLIWSLGWMVWIVKATVGLGILW